MSAFVRFIKNLFSINDESYIGLTSFSNNENTKFDRPQPRKRHQEPTLTELLKKG